jgi:predicted SprT family Zn-dependent metalloprotease
MGDSWVQHAFAYAPWVIFATIVLVAYIATRGTTRSHATVGQTYACAGCGRRGAKEQMTSVHHEGAVSWYCRECSHSP